MVHFEGGKVYSLENKTLPASRNCENTVLQGNKAEIVRGKVKCSSRSQEKLTRFTMTPFKKIGSERLCIVKALQDHIGKAAAQNASSGNSYQFRPIGLSIQSIPTHVRQQATTNSRPHRR
jgi:hypothetical protein